jgi:Interleukin-like EMT inducer
MVSGVDGFVPDAAVPVSFSLQSFGFSQGGAFFGRDKTTFGDGGGGAGGGRGFNVAIVNVSNLAVEETRNFDTWADRSSGGGHGDFVAYLDSIAEGKLVLVAVGD